MRNDSPLSQLASTTAAVQRSPRLHLGLQGKLILTLLCIVSIALGSSGWLFADQSTTQLAQMVIQQGRLVAYTLALASPPAMLSGNKTELQQMGHDLLKTRNILYVAFLDQNRKPICIANRYASFTSQHLPTVDAKTELSMVGHPSAADMFGDHIDIASRVVNKLPAMVGKSAAAKSVLPAERVLGYVVVGISLDREEAQVQWINRLVIMIGAAVICLILPFAYMIIYSIFSPIRQLVDATQKMAAGRLDIRLKINREDLIGDLARSFDEMVNQVRRQREDLAQTNAKLADANQQLGNANFKLNEANQDLEMKVRQRTGQLEAANSRLSGEIAEKEDFLRAVSHDLNAPLRNIAGMTSMLLQKNRETFSEDVIHRLDRIQKNVQVESDLISELLELSRIKTQRQQMEDVDPEGIVRDLAGVFEQDLNTRQIKIVVQTPLPILIVERPRIRQVFQNLIDNAIKYMGERPVREIRIGCMMRANEAEFYVQDTGMGIDPQDIGKVFYVFRRGKSAAAQNIPGKGVGLSSVKSIIETYSGKIWVESTLGEGTTFRFTLNGQYVRTAENVGMPVGIKNSNTDVDDAPPINDRRAA